MQANLFFLKVLMLVAMLASSNASAKNPSGVFGVALGQDVFELSAIERFGSMYMNFKIEPKKPVNPFDLYSIQANNDFQVQGIYARAKVSSVECHNELKKVVEKIAMDLALEFDEIVTKKKTTFISEDDKTLLLVSCDRYRKYREKQLNDIVLVFTSKQKSPESAVVDMEKSRKMHEMLRRKAIERREINLVSDGDFSGLWSVDCVASKSAIVVKQLRENYYHFLICSSSKCINVPRISSKDVEIVNAEHLKIAGQNHQLCATLN